MAIPKIKLNKIEEFVKEKLKDADYNHSLDHMRRTVDIAKFLALKENADLDVCVVAAWLHDIAQPIQEKLHGGIGAEMAEPFLREIGFGNEFIEKVKHCIFCHHTTIIIKAKSIEAKIIYDADKLQVIGPFGFCRTFSDFLVFKKNKLNEALHKTEEIQKTRYDNYLQTKTAKKLAQNSHNLMLEFYRLFHIWNESDDLNGLFEEKNPFK